MDQTKEKLLDTLNQYIVLLLASDEEEVGSSRINLPKIIRLDRIAEGVKIPPLANW